MVFLIAEILAFLLVAMAIGVVAGWMLFGGRSTKLAQSEAVQRELEDDVNAIRDVLEQREADVTRLRGKLRLAATELEKRANQVSSARRAHSEISAQLSDVALRFEAVELENARLQALADDAVNNPTLWAAEAASRSVDAALAEQSAKHQTETESLVRAQEAQLSENERAHVNRISELAQLVEDKEHEIAEIKVRISGLEDENADSVARSQELLDRVDVAETESVRVRTESQQLERELREQVQQLELEVSSVRLRTDSARNELGTIAKELVEFRQRNTALLQDAHTRLGGLSGRIETAHSILSGQSKASTVRSTGPLLASATASSDDELLELPGMNAELANHLRELEVRGLADVAAWSDADVRQFESWLPDQPDVIRSNDWVGYARSAIEARRAAESTNAE